MFCFGHNYNLVMAWQGQGFRKIAKTASLWFGGNLHNPHLSVWKEWPFTRDFSPASH
jgi:hypothetical protein